MESEAQALVNTVNTTGVMGKGIALQFKNRFPNNYKLYRKACQNKDFSIGQLLITEEAVLPGGHKIIINFPTKVHWRQPSEYGYIDRGLAELANAVKERKIQSIAVPPLGAGNGGLDWARVKSMIVKALEGLECEIYLYEPNAKIKEVLKKERTKLTPARTMMLSVFYDLVRHGEFVSEFSAEKVAYFLQRFGAKDTLKLDFKPKFYGPYSGKVRHVLYYLNGSYLMGYSSKDKNPFEMLNLVMDAEKEVEGYLGMPENKPYQEIVKRTKDFLSGYYSDFALELLSTVDFIKTEKQKDRPEEIMEELKNWNDRKRTRFSNRDFVNKALQHLNAHLGTRRTR